jgi:hypothetical protein
MNETFPPVPSKRCPARGALLLMIGVIGGVALTLFGGLAPANPSSTAESPAEAYALQLSAKGDGDYAFFPYRRYLWVVRRSTGTAQFFIVPESKASDEPTETSRVYSIDQAVFPLDQVRFQISERNLTNYLWIVNTVTGRAMFVRARRDGGFDESPLVDAQKSL